MLTAVSSTAACRTAKSRCRIASIISLPMPGQPKIASTTTAPLIRPTARSPATVSAGAAALRSAWWVTTRKSLAPLLRASRTYGADSAETIAPRTTWVSTPSGRIIRVAIGRIQDSMPLSTPEVGSTPSSTAKSQTPVMANQKSGMLAAVIDSRLENRSASELGR